MPMKRQYLQPTSIVVQIASGDIICLSYGTIPMGGRTDSFDDAGGSGGIDMGGTADEMDAARRRNDWDLYERP